MRDLAKSFKINVRKIQVTKDVASVRYTLHIHTCVIDMERFASLPACNVRRRAKHTVARTPICTSQTRSASCRLFVPVRSIVVSTAPM